MTKQRIAYWLYRAPGGIQIAHGCDRNTGVTCPRPDCNLPVYYNGNYFCECGWAMPDVDPSKHPGMTEFLESLRNWDGKDVKLV